MDIVEKFNEMFPVGSTVLWRSINHPKSEYKEYKVRAKARLMGKQPVAFFENIPGWVSVEPEHVKYN